MKDINGSENRLQVSHKELKESIELSRESRNTLIVKGPPGIGKSDIVKHKSKKIADKLDKDFMNWADINENKKKKIKNQEVDTSEIFILFDIRLSDNDNSDIKGLPLLDSDVTEYKPPIWLKVACIDNISGVVFLDEFNAASNAVQKSFYQIMYDRMLGNRVLSDDIQIVGAGNRLGKDRANINRIDLPLRNRVNWVTLKEPEPEEWIKWAIENDIDDRIISYIDSIGGDDLFKLQDNKDKDAIATPRTWEIASENIKDIERNDLVEMGVSMAVGKPVGKQFISFLEDKQKLDIEEYKENPEKIIKRSRDKQQIIMEEIAKRSESSNEYLQTAIDISYELSRESISEFAVVQLKMCKRNIGKEDFKERVKNEIENDDKYYTVAKENVDILEENK